MPYAQLAPIYDRWTAENPYDRWADFVERRLKQHDARRVVDLCCGTGRLTRLLRGRGFDVTGIDGSEEMLAQARAIDGEGADYLLRTLPSADLGGTYDAGLCTFDSVNYMAADGALAELLRGVATALRPGGVFIFDVNTQRKIEQVFGSSHFGDDLDDFAYVWRNRYDAATRSIEFLITLFTRGDGASFSRATEYHRQRWFTEDELETACAESGFRVLEDLDDYTDNAVTPDTMRRCLVLVKE
ncbi:class I SAM-dependent DNA methyltransferase [Micromonospora sp. NPDC049359]|uniref:class I SAM-dependent DNA methyltransferase n=1 Tax=Micromonospora sp. NPDC049359 TaxID=3364270 RepID=UPI0037AAC9E7